MSTSETFRCHGCETEYSVTGPSQPTVICQHCGQVATRYGDGAAIRAYRLGYETYREARRRLTEAMSKLDAGETTLARGGYNDAAGEFERSVEQFLTAQQAAESDRIDDAAGTARKKATCYWQAAEWLSGFTYASERGDRTSAATFRHDVRTRLQVASEYDAPTAPAELASAAEAADPTRQ
jgi:hypothetical protein